MMEAVAALATARNAVVAAHADLAKVQRLVGLGHVATGPTDKPEEEEDPRRPRVDAAVRRLRVAD
jgi:hypothetical protein